MMASSPGATSSSLSKTLSGVSRVTSLPQPPQYSVAARANRSFTKSVISVIVPTVEREVLTGFVWLMAMAGGMPEILSARGLSMRSRNWRA